MESGQLVQIAVTVSGFLGACAVALACDLLRSNNERLRQVNGELRVRHREEQRRAELAMDQLRRMSEVERRPVMSAWNGGEPVAGSPLQELSRIEARCQPASVSRMEPISGNGHPGARLEEARILARRLLASNGGREPEAPRASNPRPAAAPPRKNWDLLLRSGTPQMSGCEGDGGGHPARHKGELIPFESLHSNQEGGYLPPGLHPAGGWDYLLDSRGPFRGMVVAVGIHRPMASGSADAVSPGAALEEAIEEYLRSVLAPAEFACPSGADGYLIVSSERDGTQRRFDELVKKLSNFPLPESSTNAELFHCGGFEASGEMLSEAVRMATEKMRETRATQGAPALESSRRRKVV